MKKRTGFTLIELLISASVLSIIMLSLYSAFHTGILTYRKADSAFTAYQRAVIILNRLEADLKNSFGYCEADARFKGSDKTLEFFTLRQVFDQAARPATLFCRVKYEAPDTTLKRYLYGGLEALKDNPEAEAISTEIKEMNFQYATGKEDAPWQPAWPNEEAAAEKTALPRAVKIELTLNENSAAAGPDQASVTFARTIYLPLGLAR